MTSDRSFIDSDGQVTRWPKKASEREEVLRYLTSKFRTDRTYNENEVNKILQSWHTYEDWSSLRREIVGYGYAVRDRSGLKYQFNNQQETMEQIRDYDHDRDSEETLELLKEFQDHLASVDQKGEIRRFTSDTDARRYLNKMVEDVEEMNGKFLVLELDGKLIGFIQGIIDPRNDQDDVMYQTTHRAQIEGWIGLVYVQPANRGRKFGSKLIEAIKQHFLANGCTTLRLSVASDNTNTVNLYRKYGFVDRDIEMAMPL